MSAEMFSITLAAGASSRMPEDMRPKACCKVGAVSVIDNALQTYEAAGITSHVIVIGHAADQVMDEVTRKRRDVLFAYQNAPRGTGDAVECALDLLAGLGPPDGVVISADDKVVAPYVLHGLLETFSDYGCDFCLAAGPSSAYADAGRVVERGGKVQAIIETADVHAQQLAAKLRALPESERPHTVQGLLDLAAAFFANPEKLARCFPALREMLFADVTEAVDWAKILAAMSAISAGFELPCGMVSTAEVAAAPLSNVFVYAARFQPLRAALKRVGEDNVQGERYLTDVVQILAGEGRDVRLFRIDHAEHVMSFNTLDQIEQIRKVHAQRSFSEAHYPSLERWGNYLPHHSGTERLQRAVAELAGKIGPGRSAVLVRSPGRINLMGRHVDHQGGHCNLMAIDREIVMAAAPRDDDRINLWNADAAAYPHCTFTIGELTGDAGWDKWLHTLDTQFIQRLVSPGAGDWANYVKAEVLRLQQRFQHRQLRGMDAYVCGDIPVAAGLRSSSALLVATADAMIALNALNVRMNEFVDLCGEGAWFVGTRAGGAHYASVKHGLAQAVVTVSFFPFRIIAHHPFPEKCSLMVCHSGQLAKQTANARERFNVRVACYHMARELIKQRFPNFAPRIEHLRDVNTENLEISLPALYALLQTLPNEMAPGEAEAMAAQHPTVAACLAGVDCARNRFPLRDMALYGLAEIERAIQAGKLFDCRDLNRFGAMMRISHDGDRVAVWTPECRDFNSRVGNEQMQQLVERSAALESLDVSGAALWRQPGAYDCSTPEIDLMVDCVQNVPGVIGAQLSGAGLGGCIMILVNDEAVDSVREALTRQYYEPRELEPRISVCRPSPGSHVLTALESEG